MRLLPHLFLAMVVTTQARPCAITVIKRPATYWNLEYRRLSRDFTAVNTLLEKVYGIVLAEPREELAVVLIKLEELLRTQTEWPGYFQTYFRSKDIQVNFNSVTAVQEAITTRMALVNYMDSFNQYLLKHLPLHSSLEDATREEIERALFLATGERSIAAPHFILWNRRQLGQAPSDERFSFATRRLCLELEDELTRHSIQPHASTRMVLMQYLDWAYLQD